MDVMVSLLKKGNLGVPEWKCDYNINLCLDDGAEAYIINSNGDEILVGIYNRIQMKFIQP
jgi:hypothetical protein